MQAHVVHHLALHQQFIDVNHGKGLLPANHLDVAQATDLVYSTGYIERMEHAGEGGEAITARHGHLTHHVHLNGANITQRQLDLGGRLIARYT